MSNYEGRILIPCNEGALRLGGSARLHHNANKKKKRTEPERPPAPAPALAPNQLANELMS